jgi:hypothetical protein
VFGKSNVQLGEVKNQSSCSNKGSICILLQVNFLPTTGKLIISDVFLVTQPVLVTEGYIIYDEMSILVIVLC